LVYSLSIIVFIHQNTLIVNPEYVITLVLMIDYIKQTCELKCELGLELGFARYHLISGALCTVLERPPL